MNLFGGISSALVKIPATRGDHKDRPYGATGDFDRGEPCAPPKIAETMINASFFC
jgi:hypothetical protein